MIERAVFIAGLLALMVLIGASTLRSGQLLRTWTPPYNVLLSLPENVIRLAVLALAVTLGAVFGPGSENLGWNTRDLVPDLLLGCLVALILTPVSIWAGQAAVRRWGPEIYDNTVLRCVLPANPGEWPGVLVALLPAAALEELLFRALPLGGLSWLVAPWWLMWPLSVGFGLLHWPQGAWGVLGTGLASIVFSLLFLVTGGIWAPLAAHYLFNVLQVYFAHNSGYRPLRA